MQKKIAVLVRERQAEGMRMAVGIILKDDRIDVYVLDRKLEDTPDNALNLETMQDLDMKVWTNCRENASLPYLSTEEIAARLVDYDHILPY